MKSKNQTHVRHLPKNKIAEAYGWLGSLLILSAYALLSFGVINGNSPIYHIIFLIGSSGLGLITFRHRAYQSFVVNVFFCVLAIVALIRIAYFL